MIHKTIEVAVSGSQFHSRLITYFHDQTPELRKKTRPVILICPGGAYYSTSDREAEPLAMQFLAMGYHAAVLRYSTAPARFPEALMQLAQAVLLLRENAEIWGIDTEKIIVQGSSAGGHLAASLGVFWNQPFISERIGLPSEQFRPNGLMLCYPVITARESGHQSSFINLLGLNYSNMEKRISVSLELQVTKDTPPTFLWHTATDELVPVENSILFFNALRAVNIPVEMHIYPVGPHGLALSTEETAGPQGEWIQEECKSWINSAQDWLKYTFGHYS